MRSRRIVFVFLMQILILSLAVATASGDIDPLVMWRIVELERRAQEVATEHARLMVLLIANLVGIIVTLGAYIVTTRKKGA